MVGWGANLEPAEVGPLVSYLSASYGPDAGAYEVESMPAADAPAELAPAGDEAFPPGDATRGRALYVEKCSGCHGAEARGHIGVALIDRPFLYRPADVARTVRRGRGKMLPIPLSDAEIADVLAHLRTLRNPLP
jgi:mono/diheme cytochrome c family protein